MISAFRDMTREQFLGTPKIALNAKVVINAEPLELKETSLLPFGKYQAKILGVAGAVYDGAKMIAAYKRGDEARIGGVLFVDPAYRGQGIATELIYQCIVAAGKPPASKIRTPIVQKICEAVWDRIQKELQNVTT